MEVKLSKCIDECMFSCMFGALVTHVNECMIFKYKILKYSHYFMNLKGPVFTIVIGQLNKN